MALNASAARVTGVCRVRPDNAAAVELPLRRLAELGHTSVAFLTAPRRLMADPDRLRHFRRLSRALGLRATVLYSPLTLGDVQQATRAVLAGPDAPTAVITNSDYTAHAVYKAARELALRIGPGVSVVGHDDLATSELLDPAAGDHLAEPAGDGPGADAAPARAGPAGRLRGPGGTHRAGVAAGAGFRSGRPSAAEPPAARAAEPPAARRLNPPRACLPSPRGRGLPGLRRAGLPTRPRAASLGVLLFGEQWLAPARQLGNGS